MTMEFDNILEKIQSDISSYLETYKPSKLYQLHGFDYANQEEFDSDILLGEEDVRFMLNHLDEADTSRFNVKLCKEEIPFERKINDVLARTSEYPSEAWYIDLSVFSFPIKFTVSEIETPISLPKNTEIQINIPKDEMAKLLFATAKYWMTGNRMSAYTEIYEHLSKHAYGVDLPYVIFCEPINDMLASIIGPYKIEEVLYSDYDLLYPDDYNYYRDGGILIKITLSLCGHKLELFQNSLSLDGCKDRIITVNFPELMIKLGHYDRHEAFNKLKSILRDSNYPTDEVLITLLKANGIGYNEELNTSVCIMHSTNSEH